MPIDNRIQPRPNPDITPSEPSAPAGPAAETTRPGGTDAPAALPADRLAADARPSVTDAGGARRATDSGDVLAPLSSEVGRAVAQRAPTAPGFWRKVLDTLVEILGRLILQNPETQTYNGKIDTETFERAGRDAVFAQPRRVVGELGKMEAADLLALVQSGEIWARAPDVDPAQRGKIEAALFRGMQSAIAAAPGAGPTAPAASRNLTDIRLGQLNDYAGARLQAAQAEVDHKLAALGVTDAPQLSEVFELSLSSDYFADADLDDPEELAALREQIDATVAFLKRTHIAADGKRNPLVRFVEIVPQSRQGDRADLRDAVTQRPLHLDSSTLYVRVPDPGRRLGNDFEPVTLERLSAAWADGEFFDSDKLQGAWKIANPGGEIRTTLRHAVLPAAKRVFERFRVALGGDGAAAPGTDIAGLLQSEIHADATSSFFGGRPLLALAAEKLAGASEAQRAAFARELQTALADESLAEQSGNAAFLHALDPAHRSIKKKVTQFTLVGANVENVHQIEVLARFAPDDGLRQYAPPPRDNPTADIEIRQFNLIGANVSTHDFIDVSVDVAGHVLKAAAVDRALARVFGAGVTADDG